MKTFLRKLKLSFLAMLCGWAACNIALWLARLPERRMYPTVQQEIMGVLFYGLATGIVILVAWLVIFLPVDLLIADHSKLRRPWTASICGFLAGSSVVAVIWGHAVWSEGSSMNSDEFFTWKAFFLLSSPGITGMVAAYMRSRDREPLLRKP